MFANIEAEKKVLAGAMRYPELYPHIEAKLKEPYLSSQRTLFLYKIIQDFYNKNPLVRITPKILRKLIIENSKISNKEKRLVISHLLKSLKYKPERAEVFHTIDHLEKLHVCSLFHEGVIDLTSHLNNGRNIDKMMGRLSDLYTDVQIDRGDFKEVDFNKNTKNYIKSLLDKQRYPTKYKGLPTGIKEWDENSGGLKKEEFACILLKSGDGKSTFLLQTALYNALQCRNVLFLTIESSHGEIEERLHSNLSGVPHDLLRKAKFTASDIKKILSAQESHPEMGCINIYDVPNGASPNTIQSLIKKAEMRAPVDLVCIDYMNIMFTNDGSDAMLDWKAQTSLAIQLKRVARNTKKPVWSALQKTESDGIAFAKHIIQNLDFLVTADWVDEDLGFRKVYELKSRGSKKITPFYVHSDFSTMQFDTGKRPTKEMIEAWNNKDE